MTAPAYIILVLCVALVASSQERVTMTRRARDHGGKTDLTKPDVGSQCVDILKEAIIKEGQLSLKADEEAYSAGILAALGSSSVPFQNYIMTQIIKLLPDNRQGDFTDELNSVLAMLKAIAPKDELEAMMAAQMIAGHMLTMDSMRRVRFAEQLPQYQAHGNLANKFARTFAAQMDALGKHRRGGEQVVRYVHVNDGGQAVIAGTVVTSGGVVK